MKTSQRGLEDIIFSEGEVLHAYSDTLTGHDGAKYKDVWTIGVGHTTSAGPPAVVPGMTITHKESREILAKDIRSVEDRVLKAFDGKAPPQTVFDGAVSFDFNTGGILKATWPRIWLKGDMAMAEKFLMEWNKPAEIIGRRKREADLIFRGKYHSAPQPGEVLTEPAPAPPAPATVVPPPKPVVPAPAASPGHSTPAVVGAVGGAGVMGWLVDQSGGSHAWMWALGVFALVIVAIEIFKRNRKGN